MAEHRDAGWRRRRLASARLYLCTDIRSDRGDLAEFVEAALRGGVDAVQIREKGLEARAEISAIEVVAAAVRRHGALLSVNDRCDIATVVDADVIHVGQGDLHPADCRKLVGPDVLIGLSTHSSTEADAAVADTDVDYFCTGPVWPTPTKPGRPAPGVGLLAHVAAAAPRKPWFAIGGIDGDRLEQVIGLGATRAVVVRAITEAADPEAAARALRSRLAAAGRPSQSEQDGAG